MKIDNTTMDILNSIKEQGLSPRATMISIAKASAILIEGFASIGGDADSLEMLLKEMIGPAREEAKKMYEDTEDLNN